MICKFCGLLITRVELGGRTIYITDLKYSGVENGLDCQRAENKLHQPRKTNF